MDFAKQQDDLRSLRRNSRMLGSVLIALVACELLSLIAILSLLGSERTIVVPPQIDKSFWVTRDKASREYLEQMGGFMAWLMLDVSPSTIDWKRDLMLNYVEPDDYAALKTKMDLEADRLRNNNASSSFLIQQLTANEKDQSVLLAGRLRRQINGQDTGDASPVAYLAQFHYSGSRMHLKTFKEVPYGQNNTPARLGQVSRADSPSRTE